MASLLAARSGAASAFFGSRPAAPGVAVAPRRASAPAAPCIVASYGDLPRVGGGRKHEHYEMLPSGKPVRFKVHVKKGDTVQVIAGKDKGKVGTILRVLPKDGDVIVEGVNIGTKHIKPKAENEAGQIKNKEFPVHHSNVMLYSKKEGVRSRAGHKVLENGKKVRFLIKTGEIVD